MAILCSLDPVSHCFKVDYLCWNFELSVWSDPNYESKKQT